MIWVDIAIDTLNKQIPEKLEMVETKLISKEGVEIENQLVCPRCKHHVDMKHTVHYCTYCGKALKID